MSKQTGIKTFRRLNKMAETAEAADFTTIFGSNAQPSWFQWLMTHAGTYMFSVALIATVVKAFYGIYSFRKSPNKNINEQAQLGWGLVQAGLVVGAIAISFTGIAALALVTPVLLVISLGADTLRNVGLFAWNAIRLAMLRFKVRDALKDPNPNLTKLRYAKLKEQYLSNMKQHAIGAVIGAVITAAATVIFLMPHVGLGFVAAVGFVVGGIKITVGAILGAAAAIAVVAPFIPPVVKKIGIGLQKLGAWFKNRFTSAEVKPTEEKASLIVPAPAPVKLEVKAKVEQQPAPLKISTEAELEHFIKNDPIQHFSLFGKYSGHRELIMAHICETKKDLAKKVLLEMVDKKIMQLDSELKNANRGYQLVANSQRPRRLQKLQAMLLIRYHLTKDQIGEQTQKVYWQEVTKKYASHFAYVTDFEAVDVHSISALLQYINETYPAVSSSYALEVSDTVNILQAVQTYDERFGRAKPIAPTIVNPDKEERSENDLGIMIAQP